LAGGLTLLSVLFLATGALSLLAHGRALASDPGWIRDFIHGAREGWFILAGAAAMTVVGWIDDRHELRAGVKFLGQLGVATAISMAGMGIPPDIPSPLAGHAVAILWILTVTNALNFTDNMNGLCTGLAVIGGASFGVRAVLDGDSLSAVLGFLTAGAAAGFLPWNFPRARAFLGDAGSHLVGYLLAVLALLAHRRTGGQAVGPVAAPLLILAVPLFDLAWVCLIRSCSGKPFYVGDTNHLSHQLVRRGLTPPWAVGLLWLLAAALGTIAAFF
jgi:UDP-GlcNAc:undecaprenyl-phosphate GlcNAc-1-phosphate transferase